jgi:hypothetical protein
MDVTGMKVAAEQKRKIVPVTALFATLLLTAAVAASVGIGILFAWVVLQVFFSVVGHTTQPAPSKAPRLTLVPTQAHASGD